MFFVISQENASGGQRDPLTDVGIPDRDRQKLIREQNCLSAVSGTCLQWLPLNEYFRYLGC